MAEAEVRALMALARATKSVATVENTDTSVLDALTKWFASPDAITAEALPADLIGLLVGLGISPQAAETVGRMATVARLTGRTRYGSPGPKDDMPATRFVASEEPSMRAQYVLSAARRLTAADDFDRALQLEQHYFEQHVKAGQNRRRAARRVDELGKDETVLVWRTAGDDRVDPRCAALEGRLFTASRLPGGAIPGAVHMRCRCTASVYGGVFPGHLLNGPSRRIR